MTFEEWWKGWHDPIVGRVENGIQCHAAFAAWNVAFDAGKAEGAREEREACLKIAQEFDDKSNEMSATCEDEALSSVIGYGCAAMEIMEAIRARGEDDPAPHP